jgi:hypothetical protein
MTTVHEHEEARGGNGTSALRHGSERARERGAEARVRGERRLRGILEDLAA